ncbi:DUF58 domain-containing protein [Cellulomonas cellasea]|uniref:DUF58 domain-containing protein n=2 Tax=Cellulomonas cellasea TaxID=43670 RepID=A0A0A0B3F7_9CELL|nr:DUF58 domain-containing protein [Cellulomonas cellasea]KGM00722.1 hypothetical protein Q760_06375 [Cellulomonas cellasea DSM 20118]GEA89269.1 hypothetical protein CCE01nite_32180 [Cellulomonas cellasea]
MALRVSGAGWAAAVAAVVGLVLGRVLGWVEAAVGGAALAGLVVVALLMTVGRERYAVDLDLADRRVRVGERAVGRLAVRNVARRRSLPARIELPVGAGAADLALPSLGPGAEHDDIFAIPTSRRAVVVVGPVRSVRGDPLGLARRRVRWTEPVELYVHPELVSLAGASAGLLRDLEGQSTRDLSDSDLSFHALRDYVAGDDRRYIHWRTTARRGALMVKQFEDTRRTQTALALSTDPRDYADDDEFELAVSTVASLGVQTLREERDLAVLAGGGRLRVETPPLLLDDCAGVQLTIGGTGMSALGRRVARDAPEASVAVLVTGSVPSAGDLRAGARHVPVGTRTVVMRCTAGEEVQVRTQGSLSLATLGTLDDLPRVLRRVVS